MSSTLFSNRSFYIIECLALISFSSEMIRVVHLFQRHSVDLQIIRIALVVNSKTALVANRKYHTWAYFSKLVFKAANFEVQREKESVFFRIPQ